MDLGECGMKWLIPSLLSLASTTAAEHNLDYRDINVGSNLYADNCASCHGINLEGQPNWRSQNAEGCFERHLMMQRATYGTTTINCYSTTPSSVVRLLWKPGTFQISTAECLPLTKHSPMTRYGIFLLTSDQLGLNGSKKFKSTEPLSINST